MIHRLGQFLKRLHRDTSGKMSVEMILLLGLIALPLIIFLYLFRQTIVGWFNTQAQVLGNDQGQAPPAAGG